MRRPADHNLLAGAAEAHAILSPLGIRLPISVRYGRTPKQTIGTGSSPAKIRKTGTLVVTIRDTIERTCSQMGIDPDEIPAIIADTILHETGHVLLEHARGELELPGAEYDGEPPDLAPLYDPWTVPDEERFSEDFVMFCRRRTNPKASRVFSRCAASFATYLQSAAADPDGRQTDPALS